MKSKWIKVGVVFGCIFLLCIGLTFSCSKESDDEVGGGLISRGDNLGGGRAGGAGGEGEDLSDDDDDTLPANDDGGGDDDNDDAAPPDGGGDDDDDTVAPDDDDSDAVLSDISFGDGSSGDDDDDDLSDVGGVDTGEEDIGDTDIGVSDTGVTDTGVKDTGGSTDTGESACDHDPKDCDYSPSCGKDEDCPCVFMCISGKCLSQHCYCAELRGETPCGKGMDCDENSPTGLCVKVSTPCQSNSDCESKGANWNCVNGKCVRVSNTCDTKDPNACKDYAPAIYACVNGICTGAAKHGEPCPNHTDFDCSTGNVCINSTCYQSCQNVGEACPPPAVGTTCYQQTMWGLPVGPPYCK
ncbi:MAG: hypothetical protein Kow0090_12020 [Myxococcota bacterium]